MTIELRKTKAPGVLALALLIFSACVVPAELNLEQGNFGRLFTLPQSRALMDNYKHSGNGVQLPAQVSTQQQVRVPNQAIKLSGYILGENGQHKVWLEGNGESINGKGDARAGKPSDVSRQVPVRAQHQLRLLKPGQVWLLDEHKVAESYALKKQVVETPNEEVAGEKGVDESEAEKKGVSAATAKSESSNTAAAKEPDDVSHSP